MKYKIAVSLFFCTLTYTVPIEKYDPNTLNLKHFFDSTKPKTYILSYPRSGNTWLRYCIEFLTKRCTLEKNNRLDQMNTPLGLWFNLDVNLKNAPLWKVHAKSQMQSMGTFNPQEETLILIIRNPKEAITRHTGTPLNISMLQKKVTDLGAPLVFFENLQLFEGWNPKKRYLLYYEDLIESPEETLKRLLDFLGETNQYLESFMSNYAIHKQNSLSIYAPQNPVTEGNSLLYHSNKLSADERIKIDGYLKKAFPTLWKKYLYRYAG